MSATVWYGNLIWDCPLPGGCGTAPCDFCKEMMGEIDGTLQMPPILSPGEKACFLLYGIKHLTSIWYGGILGICRENLTG